MKIQSVHIDGFGKFHDLDLAFSEGTNVVRGNNEAGKSTLFAFIEAMLLGPNRKPRGFNRSVYETMEPWEEGAPYGGSLRLSHDGCTYLVTRVFTAGKESLTVLNEETGDLIKDPEGFLNRVLLGLGPETLRNTVSVGQLSAKTGTGLQKELNSYVESMGQTASPNLNAEEALKSLRQEKEDLKKCLKEDAAKDYAAALSRIKNLENELSRPENRNRIREAALKGKEAERKGEALREEILLTEEKIGKEKEELLKYRIREEEDVKRMEEEAEDLCENLQEAAKHKKSGLRIFGFILFSLLVIASVLGIILFWGHDEVIRAAILLAAGLLGLLILGVIQAKAVKRFRMAEAELLSYMAERNGASKADASSMEELKKYIHSQDARLALVAACRKEKEALEKNLEKAGEEENAARLFLSEQKTVLGKVEEKLSEENSLRDTAAMLRQRISENNRLKEKIDAIDIAIDTIEDLRTSIKGRLGTYLNDEASRTLKSLTGGHYDSMDIGSGSDISLNCAEGMIGVSEVSAGTMDQVYLAVRLAAARFMMGQKDDLPLFFDDSFALYDDLRLRGALEFVTSDYGGQIFIFTCHHREERALEGRQYRLIEL